MSATETSPSLKYRIFFSHHKCGTMWLDSVFRTLCEETGQRTTFYYFPHDFNHDLDAALEKDHPTFSTYADPLPQFMPKVVDYRGVHVVRDPRDVFVSGYFSHRNTHKTYRWDALVEHRKDLQALSKTEGFAKELEFSKGFLDSLAAWQPVPDRIIELKFEKLLENEFGELLRALDFLEFLQVPQDTGTPSRFRYDMRVYGRSLARKIRCPWLIKPEIPDYEHACRVIGRNSFVMKSGGRKRGETDLGSHFRSGLSGDWKNHFNRSFAELFASKYQATLEKYGYEPDETWVTNCPDTIAG